LPGFVLQHVFGFHTDRTMIFRREWVVLHRDHRRLVENDAAFAK